ncbi:MAG: hypothetical protein RLZZ244_1524, partial [Verrucomicrobiota bacterium]
MNPSRTSTGALALVAALSLLLALPQAHALDADFFTQKVEPILRSRCFECHSHAHKIKGGLSL